MEMTSRAIVKGDAKTVNVTVNIWSQMMVVVSILVKSDSGVGGD